MSEIEIGGVRYRVNRMNVFDQAHVARKVAPIIFSMGRGYAQALASFHNVQSQLHQNIQMVKLTVSKLKLRLMRRT
jgi:hypothetical protein